MIDEFPHEITFQEENKVPDGGGGYELSWVDTTLNSRAFVCPVSSKERYLAQQAQKTIDFNVFFPYLDGIKESMRVRWGTRFLRLKSKPIDQGGQGEILMLKCEEI